jgi:hypothetical protein
MKRIARYGLMLTAIAALSVVPSAWAACTLDTQLVGPIFGSTITNCPDAAPLEGYIWLLSSAATNSNGQNFICRHEGEVTDSLVDCTFAPGAGVDGDGIVVPFYEFGIQNTGGPTGGALGCPNSAQTGQGTTPVMVQVTCNDGKVVLMQIGFDADGSQSFVVDFAGPAVGGNPVPIVATHQNSLRVTSVAAGPSPSASSVSVHVDPPAFLSDCDPNSFSGQNGNFSCPDAGASRPAPGRGTLMTRIGDCNTVPDLRASGWVATTVPLSASGDATNTIDPPTGQCGFFGVQGQFGGVSGGGIISYARIGGPAAASDKVKIDSATTAQGKVKIAFSTTNETSIVGFNVYSDGAKLNGNTLIASKGAGNNAYAYEIGRGALKGGKTVLVEAVKKDGSVEKTSPVTLK